MFLPTSNVLRLSVSELEARLGRATDRLDATLIFFFSPGSQCRCLLSSKHLYTFRRTQSQGDTAQLDNR